MTHVQTCTWIENMWGLGLVLDVGLSVCLPSTFCRIFLSYAQLALQLLGSHKAGAVLDRAFLFSVLTNHFLCVFQVSCHYLGKFTKLFLTWSLWNRDNLFFFLVFFSPSQDCTETASSLTSYLEIWNRLINPNLENTENPSLQATLQLDWKWVWE